MDLTLYSQLFWPILITLSISKPISDYFWLRKFASESGLFSSLKELLGLLLEKRYTIMILTGGIFWLGTFACIAFMPELPDSQKIFIVLLFTIIFMLVTIFLIKSILVIGLIIVTFGNFLLVQLFIPLTEVNDLNTLNNLLTNLISTFNYAALATAAVGLVWQFGQGQEVKENVYGTISTMFYAIGYILLNMFISFIFLFMPTIKRIAELA